MNRITLFADIAGQRSRAINGSPRVTASAVALPTATLDDIRSKLPVNITKWKHLTEPIAREVVSLLATRSVAVAAASVDRDNAAWRKALCDADILHSEIASDSHESAGWAKLPVVLAYELLVRACLLATAHFLREVRTPRVLNSQGLAEIECSVICDQEFSGQENIDVFKSFWDEERVPSKQLAALGFRVSHPDVKLTTEQIEPLLLLADITAGLIHSAQIPNPGRVALPLSYNVSRDVLRPLQANHKLAVDSFVFDTDYERVFGDAMAEARARRAG